ARRAPGWAPRARALPRADRRSRRAAYGRRGPRRAEPGAPPRHRSRRQANTLVAGTARPAALRLASHASGPLRVRRLRAAVSAHAARHVRRAARRLPERRHRQGASPLPAAGRPRVGRRRGAEDSRRSRSAKPAAGATPARVGLALALAHVRRQARRLAHRDRAALPRAAAHARAYEPDQLETRPVDRQEAADSRVHARGLDVVSARRDADPGARAARLLGRSLRPLAAPAPRAGVDGVWLPAERRLE